MPNDNNLPPLWDNERNWVTENVPLSTDIEEEQDNLVTIEWIGRLLAFAELTNTRMLAMPSRDDDCIEWYELWFSFDNKEHRQEFLRLVKDDGYADPDEAESFKPPVGGFEQLRNLRPLSDVFDPDYSSLIRASAAITMGTFRRSA
jgi:hypothetical protein